MAHPRAGRAPTAPGHHPAGGPVPRRSLGLRPYGGAQARPGTERAMQMRWVDLPAACDSRGSGDKATEPWWGLEGLCPRRCSWFHPVARCSEMRRVARWSLGAMAGVLVAIQFIPVERTNPPVEEEVAAPEEVREILRRACYDCHSNETVWPLYSYVAPISWFAARDVRKGRAELNFSTWNRLSTREQTEAMHESWEEVAEGEMPPWFYLPPHPTARLSSEDRELLRRWSESVERGRQGEYPHE
jgi:hypothetical protein